jgi:hypothetical protein
VCTCFVCIVAKVNVGKEEDRQRCVRACVRVCECACERSFGRHGVEAEMARRERFSESGLSLSQTWESMMYSLEARQGREGRGRKGGPGRGGDTLRDMQCVMCCCVCFVYCGSGERGNSANRDLREDGLERPDLRELHVGRRAAVGEVRQPRLQERHHLRACIVCNSSALEEEGTKKRAIVPARPARAP